MKVKYFIYEDPDPLFANDPSNEIRYFVETENSYSRHRGNKNYVPYDEYKKDPNAGARVSIWKKYLRRTTEEEIILDKLTR